MALVLLSPLNALATHASSAASSWVSTGLTFSFPHKTQASRTSTGRTPQPSSPLSTPFLFTPRSRTGQCGRQESVNRRGHRGLHGLWRRPASKRELTLHSSPRLLDPGSRGQDPAGQRGRTASVWTAPAKKRFAPSNARRRGLALEIRSEVWRQRGAEQRAVTAAARARGRERPKVPRCGRGDGGRGGA